MDAEIVECIERRREYFARHYELPAEGRRKFEALFAWMEQLGEGCRDLGDFEKKLTTLTVNREMYDLMVEFAIYAKPDIEFK